MEYLQKIEIIEFTEQQEEYILSGYASYEKAEKIQEEFRIAFPESVDLFSEKYGEANVESVLEESIRRYSPGHPKFDKQRLGVLFDVLRREYVSRRSDEKMAQSRNRLRAAEYIFDQLENLASRSEDESVIVKCRQMQIKVLSEGRAEQTSIQKIQDAKMPDSNYEEIQAAMKKMSLEELAQLKAAHKKGESPQSIVRRLILKKEQEGNEQKDREAVSDELQEVSQESESEEPVPEASEVSAEHSAEIHNSSDVDEAEAQQADEA